MIELWHGGRVFISRSEGRATDLEFINPHGLTQSRNLVNVLDDFMMKAIAGLASYKCNLVPKDICRLRMQDYQFSVVVFKSCSEKKKKST